jgi:hypothetical protein
MIQFLSRPPVLIILFVLTLAIMISFEAVRAAAGDPLLDMLMTGSEAQTRLAAMSAEAKQAHFWGTVLNDTAYPLAYGSLFAGLAFRFGAPKLIYGLPSFAGAFIDLCENTIQALALSGTIDLLAAKTVLTPLKFALVAAAAGLALILMARALWRKLKPQRSEPDV